MLKKLSVLLVCIFLCASILAGCASTSPASSPVGAGDTTPSADQVDTVSPSDNSEQSSDAYQKGTVTETSYSSDYANISFTAPEGYIMATAEELDEAVEFSSEVMYADVDKKILDYAKANVVYEMMVSDPSGAPNVSVMIEKLALRNMTEKQYLDNVKPQLMEIMEYTFADYTTAEIAGETYTLLTATAEMEGVELIQDIYIRKKDDRIIGIIVSYLASIQEATDALLAEFKKKN